MRDTDVAAPCDAYLASAIGALPEGLLSLAQVVSRSLIDPRPMRSFMFRSLAAMVLLVAAANSSFAQRSIRIDLDTNNSLTLYSNGFVKYYLKVYNTGTTTLDIWPDQAGGYPIFDVSDDRWPGDLVEPGDSMRIIIEYDAKPWAYRNQTQARIDVRDMSDTQSVIMQSIDLYGIRDTNAKSSVGILKGLEEIDFGRVPIDSPAIRNVPFVNKGNVAVTIEAVDVYNFMFSKYYSLGDVGPLPRVVQPGDSFFVPVRFAPDSIIETWGTDIDVRYSVGLNHQTTTTWARGKGGPGAIVTSADLDFGSASNYLYLFKTVRMTNNTAKPVLIVDDQTLTWGGLFVFMLGDDTLPYIRMDANESKDVVFLIQTDSAQQVDLDYAYSIRDAKKPYPLIGYSWLKITGETWNMLVDSIPIFPRQTTLTPLYAEGDTSTGSYRYYNAGNDTIDIELARLVGDYFFHVTGSTAPEAPFRLAPKESFQVDFTLDGEKGGLYSDYFLIQSDTTFRVLESNAKLDIPSVTKPSLSVKSNETPIALRTSPNPASTSIEILAGHQRGVFVIQDLRGRVIASHPNHAGRWKWDLRSTSGVRAPAGSYFVRLIDPVTRSQAVQKFVIE